MNSYASSMKKYDFSGIEKKWSRVWSERKTYEPEFNGEKTKKFYNLMMFPYPSAEGLHVGNMYAFTGTDIFGRYKRMHGYDVFEPIGLDGFGIHSENYAMKIGTHPVKQAEISEKRFYKQLESIGNGFAWDEHVETYDPEYYKWTQWIFTEMWKNGLAYRKKQEVNWCPSCKTVLSDEQAEGGRCERCSSDVERKELEQWFFRITKYADRLLKNIETIDWSEKVKIAQRNWIGKSDGALVKFKTANLKSKVDVIEVFTTRVDTLFSGTFVILAPEHMAIEMLRDEIQNFNDVESYIKDAKKKTNEERMSEGLSGEFGKTGVELKGIKVINPASGEEMPIWVADFVLGSYGTGAVFADAHDKRDFEFAKKYGIPLKTSIKPDESDDEKIRNLEECFEGDGVLYNSGEFDGLSSSEARTKIANWLDLRDLGKSISTFRLRDWLISRQRYWGPPIPMIYCETCNKSDKGEQPEMPGWYAVPEKDLPVKLPFVEDFRPEGTGKSPLADKEDFYKTKCPLCGSDAVRETDVSDTFLDSSWYYIGYLMKFINKSDIQNPEFIELMKKWLPVDMYIGGAEHAVLHLLYVRFVAMALKDAGHINFEEPFPKFRAHGLVIKDGAKMSKSKGNVINPDEYIKEFGADALRMYLMFLAPFEYGGDFRDQGILGITRMLDRVWKIGSEKDFVEGDVSGELETLMHQTIKKVGEDIESLQYNTAISALMIFLNAFEKSAVRPERYFKTLLLLLAPFAPFITEELWQGLQNDGENFISIHREKWPSFAEEKTKNDKFTLIIQINGKVRDQIDVSIDITEKDAEKIAIESEKALKYLEGKTIKKVIFVSGKLINIVV